MISIRLEQEVCLKADHGAQYHIINTLAHKDYDDAAPAGTEDIIKKPMELELSTIKFEVPAKKKKKGVEKDVSPEDMFLAQGLPAACSSKLATIKYFLVTRPTYEGCICCADIPEGRIPVSILPSDVPTFITKAPDECDWKPEYAESIEFSLD